MTKPHHIAVIDIGKTNVKLALVDLDRLEEVAVVTRPNTVLAGPPWPHFDLEGHWAFLLGALRSFHAEHGIDAISTTTHGASAVLLDEHGELVAPMLDYEHDGPDSLKDAYDALRPSFSESGSPRLPMGLNLGAQLHWIFTTRPELKERTAAILTYPQYWGYRLTGHIASDVSSLGCHTDLWNPHARGYSSLPARLGICEKMASARPATDILGTIQPAIAKATGLPETTPVHVGIHDSNASLLPHLMDSTPPFSVISTGTWVIAMAVGGDPIELDPAKDTLINVNAYGEPVPSARFMGGREYEIAMQGHKIVATEDDLRDVLDQGIYLLPALQNDSGPVMGYGARWIGEEPPVGTGLRAAAVSLYLAMVSAHCLTMIGHRGSIIAEGPFTRNNLYLDMLSTATDSPVRSCTTSTGTSIGAALLATSDFNERLPATLHHPRMKLRAYAEAWRDHLATHTQEPQRLHPAQRARSGR